MTPAKSVAPITETAQNLMMMRSHLLIILSFYPGEKHLDYPGEKHSEELWA